MRYKIGIVGLGVMGSNLALNIERHGFPVAGYNRDENKTRAFLEGPAAGKNIIAVDSLAELISVLEEPRRVMMMVPAGAPVDDVIAQLKPLLKKGDILIDGGNSYFLDTEKHNKTLEAEGISFIGMGVSGGEQGALWGPSLMPGGQRSAWEAVAPIFRAAAAKAEDGQACVEYIGPRGAGHYVKMVHNGIEYADMQLIAETYDLLHRGLRLSTHELQEVFTEWNAGELQSYLLEATAEILTKIDGDTGKPLVDLILDEAEQKGTGKWTSQNALDVGIPIPTINAAVDSRILSSLKEQRVHASHVIKGPAIKYDGDRTRLINAAGDALYASRIVSYAQGMGLLQEATAEYGYHLDLSSIAKIWRAGCIIRASLLENIMTAYQHNPALVNLMLDDGLRSAIENRQEAWRFVVQTAIGMGIPVLALSASLGYFDAYRSGRLPANLTQAQRDYFGAHTYRRIDREGIFHTAWEK